MSRFSNIWEQTKDQSNIRYICGYCGTDTSPSKGWQTKEVDSVRGHVLICTKCNRPSFIIMKQNKIISTTPAKVLGNEVEGLPDDIKSLYEEARKCTSLGAYTSSVLTCRKILMHVAVEKVQKKIRNLLNM